MDIPQMQGKFAGVTSAYALTQRQSQMLRALVETGGIREAAATLGVSYTAARNAVAELKTRLGVATVPMMIGLLLELAADEFVACARAHRHDLFSLSERQFAIARSIGLAKSRQEVAKSLSLSEAVVDAELKEIYLILGVRGAGELVRTVAAAGYGTVQGRHTGEHFPDPGHEIPVATLSSDGRRIGYSDFGPAGGKPVLILHSTITSRPPPTRLVEALQQRGFRPLAIDRPGFGDTDPGGLHGDPYGLAAHDVAQVCNALGLPRIDVVVRGSGQAAMRLAQLHGQLVGRIVLVNPTPSLAFTTIDRGPLGAVKRAFGRRPWAIEIMIGMLAAYATPGRLRNGMLRSFRESAPDIALVRDDPQFLADYFRAVRGFAQGRIAGYVAEQSAWAAGFEIVAMPGKADWRIVQGRHFVLHDPRQAMAYWRDILPDTPIEWVESGGQMLAYSHPHAVLAALV
jgi:pimeloyl-ACP methyl ester carboxylesterase/DNA-binding CsgD family transcriptional regulator